MNRRKVDRLLIHGNTAIFLECPDQFCKNIDWILMESALELLCIQTASNLQIQKERPVHLLLLRQSHIPNGRRDAFLGRKEVVGQILVLVTTDDFLVGARGDRSPDSGQEAVRDSQSVFGVAGQFCAEDAVFATGSDDEDDDGEPGREQAED